jgi:tetratricopeptide (TPR) repeat protein
MKLYQDGIGRGVRNDWVYARLGYLYHTQGNREAAIASWEQAAQLNPSDHETMGNLALAYLESGKIADAERVCNWILKTGVQYAPAYNIMGLASIKKRDLQQARVYLEKAIQADPDLLDAYLNLGRIYTMIGATARARATFEAFLAKASPAEYGAVIPKVKAELAAMQ